ncbi:MAG: deoxyribodipyrimidine photo-lyase, partial [Pseudomonadota bacterium]
MADPVQIVWFKRDLRVHDHRPLARAAAAGPVLPIFVVEPALWTEPDMSARHWAFVAECLAELRGDLA